MSNFSINKIILHLQNNINFLLKKQQNNIPQEQFVLNTNMVNVHENTAQSGNITGLSPNINASVSQNMQNRNPQYANTKLVNDMPELIQTNNFINTDRAIYIRNLLGLPQNITDVFMLLQNPNKPLLGGSLALKHINSELLQNQNVLSELFNDNTAQSKIMTPEAVISSETVVLPEQTATIKNAIFYSGMICLPDISKLILQNGKKAAAEMIIAMATSSKQGIDSKQLQDTLSTINACISMAESDNPAQSLKSLMLLYLPWLPLSENTGFDMEITAQDDNPPNDSKLTVLIQTKNYGNLKGVFTLTTSNSVDIYIICSESFPKKILLQNMSSESHSHAMNTSIDIEAVKELKEENETNETKVNLSATNEMNPYLLLMAHSFIRNTISIDNDASLNLAS